MTSFCYHPTTTLFVDDDQLFLKSIQRNLGDDLTCIFYSDPEKALDFLNQTYKQESFIKHCIAEKQDADFDHLVYDINLRVIRDEVKQSDRFSEISVVVVDFSMPQLDGLEFCRQLNNSNVHKILLTGEGDADLAVDAFNKGLIHKFIMKSTPSLYQVLNNSIQELKHKYFNHLTEQIKGKSGFYRKKFSYLDDARVDEFFDKVMQDKKIVEYYILDESGGFLLIDAQGKSYLLVIKSEKDVEDDYKHAEIEGAPEDVLLPLKNKEKLLYIPDEKDLQTPPSEWLPYLHEANKLTSDKTYYYALIKDNFIKQNIKSFHDFMTDHQKSASESK